MAVLGGVGPFVGRRLLVLVGLGQSESIAAMDLNAGRQRCVTGSLFADAGGAAFDVGGTSEGVIDRAFAVDGLAERG